MSELQLDSARELALVEELVDALEEMLDRSCPDMAPLWLDATRKARGYLGASVPDLGFSPSVSFLQLGKGSRSKYRGFAAWRHAVIWRRAWKAVEEPEFRDAMDCVYFTPFPVNKPPYAWSRKASKAPGIERFENARSLKHQAKEGCFHALKALVRERREWMADGAWEKELRSMFLKEATRESLWDVLKLDDHPFDEVYR